MECDLLNKYHECNILFCRVKLFSYFVYARFRLELDLNSWACQETYLLDETEIYYKRKSSALPESSMDEMLSDPWNMLAKITSICGKVLLKQGFPVKGVVSSLSGEWYAVR